VCGENFSNAFGSFDIALYSSLILFRIRFAPIDGAVSLFLIRIDSTLSSSPIDGPVVIWLSIRSIKIAFTVPPFFPAVRVYY
jgi:hypothetical protein